MSNPVKLLHSWSFNMVPRRKSTMTSQFIDEDQFLTLVEKHGFDSHIGKSNMANILSNIIGEEVGFNPSRVKLEPGETAIVISYTGPKMDEHAQEMPEGGRFNYYAVQVAAELHIPYRKPASVSFD